MNGMAWLTLEPTRARTKETGLDKMTTAESKADRGKIGLAEHQISPSFQELSKPSKSLSPLAEGLEPVPFEEALKRLSLIVEAMEGDELPLDQLLTRFEEGTRLARHCQDQLGAAEMKISQLERTMAGELTSKPIAFVDESAT